MVSSTTTVVRYTALLSGIFYGIVHQRTLQTKYDDDKAKHHATRRAHLIEEARKAYAQKQIADKAGANAGLVTDPEDPKFDLEKLIASWEKA
ncbi:F1F0 ATP synthase subunit e, mitochondrial [Cryptotrichosporon argae]